MPQKTAAEIIKADYTRLTGDERKAGAFIIGIEQLARMGLSQVVQMDGTVFIINKVNENRYQYPVGEGEIHIFVDEPVRNLPKRFVAAAKTFKQMGYRKLHTFSVSPVMMRLMRQVAPQAGARMTEKQGTAMQGGKMVPVWRVEIDLQ